jgi:hypothetical protein
MKKILNEEFHLPHGTKSVKLVTHVDLDGLVSGISTVQQLIKQGIPKDRIVIEFAQYGDEKKDKNFDDRFNPNNKNQKVFDAQPGRRGGLPRKLLQKKDSNGKGNQIHWDNGREPSAPGGGGQPVFRAPEEGWNQYDEQFPKQCDGHGCQ